MKRIWICVCSLLIVSHTIEAQSKSRKAPPKKTEKKSSAGDKLKDNTIRLYSESENQARAGIMVEENYLTGLSVSDPYIKTLNIRARGYDPGVKNVAILGMPKGAYGFAHGRLRVFPSSTTSSGTLTGMGAVATGSHLGVMGSTGLGMGVNGKSPFAGTAMWGIDRGLIIPKADVALSRTGY